MRHNNAGQTFIAMAAGLIVLVILFCFLADIVVLVQAYGTSNDLATKIARTISNGADAASTVTNAQTQFKATAIIPDVKSITYSFDQTQSQLTVTTTVDVKLPFPVPFIAGQVQLQGQSVAPVLIPQSATSGT